MAEDQESSGYTPSASGPGGSFGPAPAHAPGLNVEAVRAQIKQEREQEQRHAEYQEAMTKPAPKTELDDLWDRLADDDEYVEAGAEDPEGNDDTGRSESDEAPPPSIETPEEVAEREAAVARLRVFDPADGPALEGALLNGASDDQKAEAEYRLWLMKERGEYAHVYSRDLQAEIDGADQEMAYLDDEIRQAKTLRERRPLEDKWVEISRRVPRLQVELANRAQDAASVEGRRKRAEAEAAEQIMEERRTELLHARGYATLEEMKAGKKHRRQTEAKIEQALWNLDSPLDAADVNKRADRLFEQATRESWANRVKRHQGPTRAVIVPEDKEAGTPPTWEEVRIGDDKERYSSPGAYFPERSGRRT